MKILTGTIIALFFVLSGEFRAGSDIVANSMFDFGYERLLSTDIEAAPDWNLWRSSMRLYIENSAEDNYTSYIPVGWRGQVDNSSFGPSGLSPHRQSFVATAGYAQFRHNNDKSGAIFLIGPPHPFWEANVFAGFSHTSGEARDRRNVDALRLGAEVSGVFGLLERSYSGGTILSALRLRGSAGVSYETPISVAVGHRTEAWVRAGPDIFLVNASLGYRYIRTDVNESGYVTFGVEVQALGSLAFVAYELLGLH